jgi:hypothetical protein
MTTLSVLAAILFNEATFRIGASMALDSVAETEIIRILDCLIVWKRASRSCANCRRGTIRIKLTKVLNLNISNLRFGCAPGIHAIYWNSTWLLAVGRLDSGGQNEMDALSLGLIAKFRFTGSVRCELIVSSGVLT